MIGNANELVKRIMKYIREFYEVKNWLVYVALSLGLFFMTINFRFFNCTKLRIHLDTVVFEKIFFVNTTLETTIVGSATVETSFFKEKKQ